MTSTIRRRLKALEQNQMRRDVPPFLVLVSPLSAEDEAKAADYRRRGSVVVVLSERDAML